ncbi:MAG: hypothetical protein CMI31_12990 [Opitutae bacterium]|nr:hypothetical protein [Opitutae bacterium]|tara:strand:+ start:526 stop:864 length:339 start_codon:yes stop_codon:yes gene_type:complete
MNGISVALRPVLCKDIGDIIQLMIYKTYLEEHKEKLNIIHHELIHVFFKEKHLLITKSNCHNIDIYCKAKFIFKQRIHYFEILSIKNILDNDKYFKYIKLSKDWSSLLDSIN